MIFPVLKIWVDLFFKKAFTRAAHLEASLLYKERYTHDGLGFGFGFNKLHLSK